LFEQSVTTTCLLNDRRETDLNTFLPLLLLLFDVHNLPNLSNLVENLREWLNGANNVVVAGIGNEIRMDDFVGVKIVRDLEGKVPKSVHLIECETVPESFMDEIVDYKPSHVLLIDAAILGLNPGEVRLYDPCKVIDVPPISTHSLPVRVFCDYVTELTKAKIALLLIEPKDTDFGEGLTGEVALAAGRIVEALLNVMS
jgi:hydrogenase 3 maturation protease